MTEEKKIVEEKKPMGKNQKIGIYSYGIVFVTCVVMVFMDKIKGPEFLSFLQWFAPIAITTILTPSAVIKSVKAFKK